jgi:hypothetical protein
MFGIGFLNSVFLMALAAMALPIVIHLLNRRRVRHVSFSSLDFIFELSRRRMSKVNLRRWIVLLLRTFAVILIVLAFARPTMRAAHGLLAPGKAPKHVVICLDASASMRAELAAGTAFTVARTIAERVVDDCGDNDLIDVILCGARDESLIDGGSRNKQIIKNAIGGVQASSEAGSMTRAVEAALDRIRRSDLGTGEVYVISDFRQSADSVLVSRETERTRVILLPVYQEAIDNVSIDRVLTPRKLIRPGEIVRIGASLTNHSRDNPAETPVELFVENARKAEKVVNLSPSASANVTFSVAMNEPGVYRCRVTKHQDRLPLDDDRFFELEVSQRVPITLVRGSKFADDGEQTAAYFYVDKALNPRGSGEGEFGVKVIDEKELTAASLPAKGVVVWVEPREMDDNRFHLLKRYLHGGGAMLVFVGSDRKGLWRDRDFATYFGMQKPAPREVSGGARFSALQKSHPILEIFNQEELELLSQSRIRSYLSVAGVAPDSVLAFLGGGDPGVWECRRGDGRVIVVAAVPDMASGNLPLSPMFLPFVHTVVSYLASAEGSELHRENHPGNDLLFDLPPAWKQPGDALRVRGASGEETGPLIYESPDGTSRALISRPREVGFYALLADTTVIAQAAVNVDTQESNLNPRKLDDDYLSGARVVDTSTDLLANLRREKQGREIYSIFLLLAISALALESLLGRKA